MAGITPTETYIALLREATLLHLKHDVLRPEPPPVLRPVHFLSHISHTVQAPPTPYRWAETYQFRCTVWEM